MANIKSAKKRILVTEKRTARNKSIKSAVKTSIKKVEAAIAAKDKAAAEEALKAAIGQINRAATKGVYHKNTAARKIDIYDKETTSTVMLVIFLLSETGCVAELLLRYSNEPQ